MRSHEWFTYPPHVADCTLPTVCHPSEKICGDVPLCLRGFVSHFFSMTASSARSIDMRGVRLGRFGRVFQPVKAIIRS
jgi:hypothetical protein